MPYWNDYNCNLLEAENSLERLFWLLSNPLELHCSDKKIGLMLSLHQTEFLKPTFDADKIDEILKFSCIRVIRLYNLNRNRLPIRSKFDLLNA